MRLLVSLSVLFIACGGGPSTTGGAACTATTGCGGNIVGTWKVSSICDGSPPGTPCDRTTVAVTALPTWTYQFNSDGTFTLAAAGTLRETCTTPAPPSGSSCSNYNDSTSASTTSCSGDATKSCTCSYSTSITANLSGTYKVANGIVTTLDQGDTAASTQSYCVNDDSLVISDSNGSAQVYTKQ